MLKRFCNIRQNDASTAVYQMSEEFRALGHNLHVLATDLDGTLIPLSGNSRNREDLQKLAKELHRHEITLVFVTGRHLESVQRAMKENALPVPDWVICDVGTTIYRRMDDDRLCAVVCYHSHLESIIARCPIAELRQVLSDIPELQLQEQEKQGRFKLSYYTQQSQIEAAVQAIQQRLARTEAPYSLIHSIDPFTGDGLIDLLPEHVSKAYALHWWVDHAGIRKESVVFAGDSGNDLAAFEAGYRAIVVGNTNRDIARQVAEHHQQNRWEDRLCLAERHGTSGVLEGCYRFGILSSDEKE